MNELIIADDHPLFREALAASVKRSFPQTRIIEADTIDVLMELVEQHPEADMLLLDLTMPGATGYSALVNLRDRKSTRLNYSHVAISYAVFCLQKINNA